MNKTLLSTTFIFVIIISSILLQNKIKEYFQEFDLDKGEEKIKTDRIQTGVINNNTVRINKAEKEIDGIKNFVPYSTKRIKNSLSRENSINNNERIFNNIASFKYGEDLFLTTYHWGGYVYNNNKFNNRVKSINKKIKIKSLEGKKTEENIKYGDYISIPGFSDKLRILPHNNIALNNSIFPGNYFYLQSHNKKLNNLQINWRNNRNAMFTNRNKGSWERMKLIRRN
jgi:hypothetical protein